MSCKWILTPWMQIMHKNEEVFGAKLFTRVRPCCLSPGVRGRLSCALGSYYLNRKLREEPFVKSPEQLLEDLRVPRTSKSYTPNMLLANTAVATAGAPFADESEKSTTGKTEVAHCPLNDSTKPVRGKTAIVDVQTFPHERPHTQ